MSYFDENGEKQKIRLRGMNARIAQHEYDHLDGILAVSRAIDGRSFALKERGT